MKTILTLLFFPLAVLAQTDALGPNDLRDRAFRMSRATVEFLATDAKTYGYPDKTTCPDCVSYPRLKAFIVEQKLTKADELVNETERWVAAPATAAKSPSVALAELRTQLMNRVTAGSERQHRRGLPSFATYESQMNQLAGGRAPESIAMNTSQQTDAPDATADVEDAQADTASSEGGTVMPLSRAQTSDNSWLSKSGLALILSLLSLGLVGWLLATRKKGDTASKGVDATTDGVIAKLSDDVFRLKGERNTAQDASVKLQNRVAQLENQVAVLQKAVGVASAVLTSAVTPTTSMPGTTTPGPSTSENMPKKDGQPISNPVPVQRQQAQASPPVASNPTPVPRPAQNIPPAAPAAENRPRSGGPVAGQNQRPAPTPAPANTSTPAAPRILYARTVDLGDGFSADSLSETTSERPMVYQIQLASPTQASFRVADDPYAQRLALSDPYSYLNDACEYTSQPAANSRIQTVKPGRLTLQGGKWAITEKAQISFT